MTLFNKLAGKASANAECKRYLHLITALTAIAAGAANAALIFSRSRKAKLNGCEIMQESTTCRKISALFWKQRAGPDLSCPFRNEHTKQCDVYSVRPLICKGVYLFQAFAEADCSNRSYEREAGHSLIAMGGFQEPGM